MAKKYLDETGLQTLWSKVKSQDTDTLSSAKTYADEKSNTALTNAKSYTKSIFSLSGTTLTINLD